jgi:hypothetical protein
METQEEKSQNQTMLAPLASEPVQVLANDSLLYHMNSTILCATRFNHVLKANLMDDSRTSLATHPRNHFTRVFDELGFVEMGRRTRSSSAGIT